jgi:hypothetical protein
MTPQVDRATLATTLQSITGRAPFPTWDDRAAWQRLHGGRVPDQIMRLADQALNEPTPPTRATDYLAFYRNGSREPWEQPIDRRRDRLIFFALAECLEGQNRFGDAILNEAWAICEESTWVTSAHSAPFPHNLPDPTLPLIDLWSAITSFTLAEIDYLLGAQLHPALRTRIRYEIERRSTLPYLERNDYPWLGYGPKQINNWLPVCVGGTACAALYLEQDHERLATILERAISDMRRYLATFGSDGACREGVGYWEKGFAYFVMFAHLLGERTAGAIDLLDDPHVRRIAAFPAQVELSPGQFVAFSDTGIYRKPQAALLHFLDRRYDLPELAALDHEGPDRRTLTNRGPSEKLRDLWWYPERIVAERVAPPAATYFADSEWLIARSQPDDPGGLVLAAKGGHNAEPHNHNDVGSFMLHWRGESLIAELGAGRYTRDYFRAEHRYTLLPNGSQGHSVPIVNGHTQSAGAHFRATDVRYDRGAGYDSLTLDLAAAYPPAADLAALQRRITLHRAPAPGYVELTDRVQFARAPGDVASVLISFGAAEEHEPGRIVISGQHGQLAVAFDATQLSASIERIPGVDLRHGVVDVTRIVLALRQPARAATITLQLTPVHDR